MLKKQSEARQTLFESLLGLLSLDSVAETAMHRTPSTSHG